MTTIIGRQYGNRAELCADIRTVGSGDRQYDTVDMEKARYRAEYVLAAAGPAHLCEYFLHTFELPYSHDDTRTPMSAYRFMVSRFVPDLRRALQDDLGVRWDGTEGSNLQALVIVNGLLFGLDTDGTVLVHRYGLLAIGSGSGYALGALMAQDALNLKEAVDIASLLDAYTGPAGPVMTQGRNYA